MFDVWMNILRAVDNSVLWFYAKAEQTQANIRAEAAARSVDPNRIIFAPVTAHDEFLARLPLADLYLDTIPYNAGATCNDAIWAGLPVLTCTGNTYVGRMATSLLHAASLSELVTSSLADYQALAIKLGQSRDLMQSIRAKTALARTQGPLFDMVQFTADLERAYRHMHHHWNSGLPLEPFAVDAVA
jgi:predicted O-linked N-acetylglucosamine transferase (SPINDLY family)